jgi:hypothetical protein
MKLGIYLIYPTLLLKFHLFGFSSYAGTILLPIDGHAVIEIQFAYTS